MALYEDIWRETGEEGLGFMVSYMMSLHPDVPLLPGLETIAMSMRGISAIATGALEGCDGIYDRIA